MGSSQESRADPRFRLCRLSSRRGEQVPQVTTHQWQRRRDVMLDELADFTVIPPHGGWSFLVDVSRLGLDGPAASKRLLELGKIAATPMVNWGSENSRNYVRIVFSNEPVQRLRGIGQSFKDALT